MIVGSGLVARAFVRCAERLRRHCIYAAGVSNSGCIVQSEYARDKARLRATLATLSSDIAPVYVSTCSILDPASGSSMYVAHKRAMEDLVLAARDDSVVVRFPQLAGDSPNPHTLLNYLFARIIRSERFDLWAMASRNIIDADHAADITTAWLDSGADIGRVVSVANPVNYSMAEIVAALEAVSGRSAIFDTVQRGSSYAIDVAPVAPLIRAAGVLFGPDYLVTTVAKYFRSRSERWMPRLE